MSSSLSKNTIVFYHGGCDDGFTSAWVAWRHFRDSAEYIKYFNGSPLSLGVEGKKIFFLDCVPSKEDLEKINEANDVTVIDHHKSNYEKLEKIKDIRFDLKKAGCVLSWEYFHDGSELPLLLKYIQDKDLWQWKLDMSEEIFSYISAFPYDFKTWDELSAQLNDDRSRADMVGKGKLICQFRDSLVDDIIEKAAQEVIFEGYKVMAVNSPVMADEIGKRLYRDKYPFTIIWIESSEGIRVSLRGRFDTGIDLSLIASKYGGGGHPTSCGFKIKSEDKIPWQTIRKEENE